ncbi:MAG TPA: ATP-dependent DNA ligase [Steroidobacteraceae bacterium]|nr:ATP-dependent DNA ligase [Steroidobacteraceae bacterium]
MPGVTLLAALVDTSQRVGASAARLVKIRELATLLAALQPEEIEIAAHYLSGELPQGRIGTGFATLQEAAAQEGAERPTLPILDVDARLTALAATRGAGSAARRAALLRELFAQATVPEQAFLLRLLVGELRQGALAGVMVEAIAAAARVPVVQVRRAAMYSGSLGAVARVALQDGAAALGAFQLELFSPVSPMLAQTAADVGEALRQLPGELAFEWKMDGARIQLHKRDDEVRIYTRSLNDVTAAVPEIVALARTLTPRVLILDGEAIAFDDAGRPLPFQITMRRFGRKLRVEETRAGLPIRAFFFDCLRLESESIADLPTRERFAALASAVPCDVQIPRLVTASEPAARDFYEAALAAGHEGVMAKSLDAPYEAGNRGASWLKIKRAHTLDLVVLAAEWGHGRRSGWLSNLHLGALDPATGDYVMLGKTFKGLTDAMLEWQTAKFLARETRRDAYTVYLRPELVVEIAFSDLQASSRYPGGLALRLARVKRYREDKSAQDADTMDVVRRLYAAQSSTGAAY